MPTSRCWRANRPKTQVAAAPDEIKPIAQAAGDAVCVFAYLGHQVVHLGQHAAGSGDEALAGVGGFDASREAVEQANPESSFDLGDAARDR